MQINNAEKFATNAQNFQTCFRCNNFQISKKFKEGPSTIFEPSKNIE